MSQTIFRSTGKPNDVQAELEEAARQDDASTWRAVQRLREFAAKEAQRKAVGEG